MIDIVATTESATCKFSELVPPRWQGDLQIKTREDLVFLGKPTLAKMIDEWVWEGSRIAKEIEAVKKNLGNCDNFHNAKTAKSVKIIRYFLEDRGSVLEKSRAEVAARIGALKTVHAESKEKPILPRYRQQKGEGKGLHFHPNSPVVIFRLTGCSEAFTSGTVKQNGTLTCVTVLLSDNRKQGFSPNSPQIMHLWEWQCLMQNPDFAKLWASHGPDAEFDVDDFLFALACERGRWDSR